MREFRRESRSPVEFRVRLPGAGASGRVWSSRRVRGTRKISPTIRKANTALMVAQRGMEDYGGMEKYIRKDNYGGMEYYGGNDDSGGRE